MDKLKKLKGSILIETIAAMILIMVIAWLVFSFFIKISLSEQTDLKVKAFTAIHFVESTIKSERIKVDTEWELNDLTIKCKVKSLLTDVNLYSISIFSNHQSANPIISYNILYKLDAKNK